MIRVHLICCIKISNNENAFVALVPKVNGMLTRAFREKG